MPCTHLLLYVNKVNHKPQRVTCQLLQPGPGAEPKRCCASVKPSITNWHPIRQRLKHYSKHKHLNLISWLLDGYVYSETIHSSFFSQPRPGIIKFHSGGNGLRVFAPKWLTSPVSCCSFQNTQDKADILNCSHKAFTARKWHNTIWGIWGLNYDLCSYFFDTASA